MSQEFVGSRPTYPAIENGIMPHMFKHRYECTLKGRIPSKKNEKRVYRVGNRCIVAPSKNFKEWHDVAMVELTLLKPPLGIELSHVELTFYSPDMRRADLTNKAESIMDLLVDGGVIVDDSWHHVPYLPLKYGGNDPDNPRVEIAILY